MLGVVVIVHELGHFLAARALGITVETFSVGFGPEIAGFYDKSGTRWRVASIPLGGYVKFKGDETVASLPSAEDLDKLTPAQRQGNFHTAALWRRTIVVLAGPFANFPPKSRDLHGDGALDRDYLSTGRNPLRGAGYTCGTSGIRGGGRSSLGLAGQAVRSFEDFELLMWVLNARSPIRHNGRTRRKIRWT